MKNRVIILIVILLTFSLMGCGVKKLNTKANNKMVNENDITILKIHNYKGEFKEIKDKNDISKVIALINDLKILENDIGLKDGVGYGTEITYSDGKIENLSFSNTFMVHNNKYYEVDKNITNDLKNIYDKN